MNDFLNRDTDISNVFDYINGVNGKVLCLNGSWGCGKTFILKEVIDRMEKTDKFYKTEKEFFPVYINIWEYDYYNEPLEAFVLALYDYAFPKTEQKFKDIFSTLLASGLVILKDFIIETIKSQTGIDFNKFKNNGKIKKYLKNFGDNRIFDKIEIDSMSALKQTLYVIKEIFNKLSSERRIVIFIDDLDRCLPEFAIKTLERLHHISSEVDGINFVIALDKKQLSKTISGIYGDIDIEAYLCKFIDSYYNLSNGTINLEFSIEYPEYYSLFSHEQSCCEALYYVLYNMIDKNIRNWKKVVDRVYSIHKIITKNHENRIYDNSLLVAELFYSVICNDKNAMQTICTGNYYEGSNRMFENLWGNLILKCAKIDVISYPITKYILNSSCWHKVIMLITECKNQILVEQGDNIVLPYIFDKDADSKLSNEKMLFLEFVEYFNNTKWR